MKITILSLLRDLRDIFWPPICPVCGILMTEGSRTVCYSCRLNAPFTDYWTQVDNPVARKFWGLVPIINASSFLFFIHGNGYRELIHGFKYQGRWADAYQMGRWYGGELARSGLYAGVDIVIPVPLHIRKKIKRGYNQSEYIARGIAKSLGVPVDTKSTKRCKHNPSQALKEHHERWKNVEDIFTVRNENRLANCHILLVDDVLTTGATITSCAEAIIKAIPTAHISIAVLAVTPKGLETP